MERHKELLIIFPFLFILALLSTEIILKEGVPLKGFLLTQVLAVFLLCAIVDVKASILLVFLWLPFKGLIRRLFYLIAPFQKYDIVHLTEPFYLVFLIIIILLKERRFFREEIRDSKVFRVYLFLLFFFTIQIFNPLQGSLFAGFSGSIFILFPALWFIPGILYGDEGYLKKVLNLVAITSFITSIYGIFQFFHGLMPFEESWVKNIQKGYVTIKLWGHPRAFSTFMSPEESSRYFAIGGAIMAGKVVFERSISSIFFLIPVLLSLLFTGVRSSTFGFLFSLLLIFSLTAKDIKRAFLRGLFILLTVFLAFEVFISPPKQPKRGGEVSEFYYYHVLRGLKAPTEEESFQIRLEIWKGLLTDYIIKYPMGHGLGSGTLGASKFGGEKVGTESYFFSLLPCTGIPGFLTFIYLFYLIFRKSLPFILDGSYTCKIAFCVLSMMMLNNIFGNTFGLYTAGAIGWLLSGSLAKTVKSISKRSE